VRVELKCSQNLRQAETFSVRKNGGNQIWKKFCRPGRVLVELPRPSALRTRL
jgi:hypothetical protein